MNIVFGLLVLSISCIWAQNIDSSKGDVKNDTALQETPQFQFGTVNITSGMIKANIWVDNKKLGFVTPYSQLKLQAGNHTLFIENQFYYSDTCALFIEAGKHQDIEVLFREKFAYLTVRTDIPGVLKHRGVIKKIPLYHEQISNIDSEISFSSFGYEDQNYYLKNIPHGKEINFDLQFELRNRWNTLYRSALFPGYGQHYTERKFARNIWGTAALLTIGWVATNFIINGNEWKTNSVPIFALGCVWTFNIIDSQVFYPYSFKKNHYTVK